MEQIGLKAVMDMTDFEAGARAYDSAINQMTKSGSELSDSAKNQLISLTDLAQVLSDGGPAKLAATSVSQLKQQFMDGSITAEQYASAVTQVQDEFGLVSPTGKAAAGALTELNAKFAAGEISAEEYAEGLKNVDMSQETTGKSAVELAAQIDLIQSAYDAVAGTIGQAVELAELGVQAERAERRFRAFAGEIGDADELLAAFQKGAGGTVDKMTAMSSAAKLLQMGLVSNNAEMEQVVEIATRLGDQTQSAGDRVADFALLLANQSIPRLDNFGISSGKVRARIDELIKSGQAAGREDAFKMAVFEEGAKSLDVLGERTVDAGAKMEMARAKIADMKVEFAQGLLPVVASAFEIIGNLNTKTIAMIAILGGGVPVVMKLHGALTTLKAGLDTTYLKMGLLAAGIVLLVSEVDKFNNQMDKMAAEQDRAQEAAGSLGDQVQALVDDGMSLGEAMAQVGTKVNTATNEFNNATILGVIPLKNALNSGAEFTKTMQTATESLQGALVANVSTYPEYIAQVQTYNAGITDSAGRIETLTQRQFEMMQAQQAGTTTFANFAREIASAGAAMGEQTQAVVDNARETRDQELAVGALARGHSEATREVRDATLAMEGLTAADVASTEARQGAVATSEAIAQAAANRASIAEKAAAIEQMQANSALASAAALEEKRKKDIAVVQAEQDLAQSVMNASDAMIAQTFIQGLDPEQMGLTAYRRAVEDIQLAFGLATPESIKLAHGITQGIEAANAGEIAYGDLDQFINDLIADSETGADTFAKYGVAIDDSASASEKLSGSSQALAADLAGLDDDAATAAAGMDAATESTHELDAAMSETAGAAPGYGAAIGSGLRSGMEPQMDGFVASFRAKLQSIKDQLPSSEPKDPSSPLHGLGRSGRAIIINLADGMESMGDSAVETMADIGANMGTTLGKALASSMLLEVEEGVNLLERFERPTELFGIAGVVGGLGSAAASIFQREVLDPLEEKTAGLESMVKEQIKIIERETKELEEIRPDFSEGFLGHFQEQIDKIGSERVIENLRRALESGLTAIGIGDERVTRAQILAQQDMLEQWINASGSLNWSLERRIDLQNQLGDTYEKLNAEQARLNELQRQQEALKFLEQQMNLLKMIEERGLDVESVLGGLKLGIDANAGLVMDAMARAMEQIISQAEDELGIASPSKVFEKIGAETMSGMAMGIERLMSLPVAQSAIATQAMIATPASIVSAGSTNIDNSRTVGDINISAPGGATAGNAQLVATIRQVVREEVRGT